MTDVTLNIPARTPHLCSVLTGFILLEKQGKLRLKLNTNVKMPSASIMEAIIDGKRLAYDMADGYNFRDPAEIERYIDSCDFYFKRSFSDELNDKLFPKHCGKIYRWGFNYLATCDGNGYFNHNPEKRMLEAVNFFRGRKPLKYFTYDRFEAVPNKKDEQRILFMTRLWSASQTSEKNLDAVNSMRIEITKALRKEYPNNSVTGIYDGVLARELCPELVLSGSLTKRENFLETIKKSDICIGSIGLHGSIGWKTGEYVAASRAIINEKLRYEVTGDFEAEKNYLDFESVDECMANVEKLFNDPDSVYEMKRRNRDYYLNYLRPDIQVANSLKEAGITL